MTQNTSKHSEAKQVHVLIVTALKIEYDAVLQVETESWEGACWEEMRDSSGRYVAFRTFKATNGAPMRVAVVRARDMGSKAATHVATQLVEIYKPHCLAICGVCAGRRGHIDLGDVIIADTIFSYGNSKLVAEFINDTRVEQSYHDIKTYEIHRTWKQSAEKFQIASDSKWLADRPQPYEVQMDWVLDNLRKGKDPRGQPAYQERCPDWADVLERLWKKKLLRDGSLYLTEQGKAHIDKLLLLNRDSILGPKPFRVQVGAIFTGDGVVKDPEAFERLARTKRTVLGLEMEAAAIGNVSYEENVSYTLAVKGVMDFADSAKNDHFKHFAARASAECLIAFLRDNLPLSATSTFTLKSLGDLVRMGESNAYDLLRNNGSRVNSEDMVEAKAMGILLLYLRRFDEAQSIFERVVHASPHWADAQYYYALSLLRGRSPRVIGINEAKRILEHIANAIRLDSSVAVFESFAAIIKREHFMANGLRVPLPDVSGHLFRASTIRASTKLRDTAEVEGLLRLVSLRNSEFSAALRQ